MATGGLCSSAFTRRRAENSHCCRDGDSHGVQKARLLSIWTQSISKSTCDGVL